MSNYTCIICGELKNDNVEDWGYYDNGVACESCCPTVPENESQEAEK